jgi:hypothetical protein
MWKKGVSVETPAEYKKRTAPAADAPLAAVETTPVKRGAEKVASALAGDTPPAKGVLRQA